MIESTVAPLAVQPALFTAADGSSVHLIDVPVGSCRHSRFNTRKTRDPEAVARLAERIARMGFERTRALWAVQAEDGGYEVFAGGTRWEAAVVAGLDTVPLMLHVGYSEEAISRRADLDNENDEYHQKVSPVDVWAEYARLRDDEKWNQKQIAKAKGEDEATVSRRLKFHRLPDSIKRLVETGLLAEGHLQAITGLVVTSQLHGWLTPEEVWVGLCDLVVYGQTKNGGKSVRATGDDVKVWREFITRAEAIYQELDGYPKTAWDISGDEPVQIDEDPAAEFVAALASRKARSLAEVAAAETAIKRRIADAAKAYQRWLELRDAQATRAAIEAEARQAVLSKFHQGDGVAALQAWQGAPIRLLMTDPPYGMDYQSNRRWASKAPEKIKGDGRTEALPLIAGMLEAATPRLADDAHVLVFTGWELEPEVRRLCAEAGLKVKPLLIWKKEEHTAGDVKGSFGVDYELIVHAVKGSPEVTPRRACTFEATRTRETAHPSEKPLALLAALIDSCTTEGDLVADPFAGAASTLVAALCARRDFWGAEVEEGYHDEGSTRLLKAWEEAQR